MAGEPKISAEDVRKRLNGVYSGSDTSYWFFENSISSGSLWDLCSGSSIYIRTLIGDSIMDSTSGNTSRQVKETELLYTCFQTLINLSGGVIVQGFTWDAGFKVSQPSMLPTYINLINEFKMVAQNNIRSLQTFVLSEDMDMPNIGNTASSAY